MIIDGSAYVRALGLEQFGFSLGRTGLPSDNPKERLTFCVATTGDVQKLDVPRRLTVADLRAHLSRSLSIPLARLHLVLIRSHEHMFILPKVPADTEIIGHMISIAESFLRVYDLNSPAPFFINVMIKSGVSRIRVLPTDSITTLRSYINEVFPGEYDIDFFAADLDEAATTLRAAGVTPEMELKAEKMRPPPLKMTAADEALKAQKARSGYIRLQVETSQYRQFYFFVYKYDLVQEIAKQISDKEGIPLDHQRLFYGRQQLEHERPVSDYSIKDDATIHLVLRLCGGMFQQTSGRDGFSATAVRHVGVGCNHCGCLPIRGARYQCNQCNECDICELCEASGLHHDGHVLTKITDSRLLFKDLAQGADMTETEDEDED